MRVDRAEARTSRRLAARTDVAPPASDRGAGPVAEGATLPPLIQLTLPGEPRAVRAALAEIMAALEPLRITPESRDSTQLVLAEVLNNVVEHAYALAPGPIDLELRLADTGLACTVRDRGLPMPDGTPPSGRQALVDVPLGELPEGGFGWFLIRSLTRDLDYLRAPDGNRLSFLLPIDRHAPRG